MKFFITIVFFFALDILFCQTKDSLSVVEFDSLKHYQIREFSGDGNNPPVRFYVDVYDEKNKNILRTFFFQKRSFKYSPIKDLTRQEIISYCEANATAVLEY